jgi:hypothetical protein
VYSDYLIIHITGFPVNISNVFVKLFGQKIYRHILYINNDRNALTFNCMPGSEQVVTELQLSPPTESGSLERNVMFHKNSFLLQGSKIMSCVWVTYRRGFGLDDWIYCTLYVHTTHDYRQYNAIADLHTLQSTVTHALGFSVFTSCILAMDLSQSHCHFKSHIKSSCHSLIPFLPLFCNCQLNSIPLLPSSCTGRLASQNSTLHVCSNLLYAPKHFFYNGFA